MAMSNPTSFRDPRFRRHFKSTRTRSGLRVVSLGLGLIATVGCATSTPNSDSGPGSHEGLSAGDVRLDSAGLRDGRGVDSAASRDAADADGASDGSGALSTESYCARIVEFFCPFYLRCGRIAEADLASCTKTFMETCVQVHQPHYRALELAGLLRVSDAGLAACRQHLETVPCEQQLLDLEGPCRGIWQGRQAAHGACGINYDAFICGPQETCIVGPSLCGQCEAAAPSGGSCDTTTHCRYPDKCVAERCVRPALPAESCGDARNCIAGASCVAGSCVARSFVTPGAPCDAARRCPYRSVCLGGRCVRTGLLGEACDSGLQPCASGYCDPDTKRCTAFRGEGEACSEGYHCRSGRCLGERCPGLLSSCL